tara:strand:- start:235 stop:465 length:231 start_codon:yes stop_codon:yes gene_type:complete
MVVVVVVPLTAANDELSTGTIQTSASRCLRSTTTVVQDSISLWVLGVEYCTTRMCEAACKIVFLIFAWIFSLSLLF